MEEDDIEIDWRSILTVEGLGQIQGRNLRIEAHTVSVEDEGMIFCISKQILNASIHKH